MKYTRLFISCMVLLSSFFLVEAQENKYVYKDSAIFYADSVAADKEGSRIEEEEDNEVYDYEPDTTLTRNDLELVADSVAVLKRSQPLLYAQNLDSLLKGHSRQQQLAPPKKSWLSLVLLASITQYFFWLLAALFIGVILYQLFFTQGLFQRAGSTVAASRIVDNNREGLSIQADYAQLVNQAIAAKDFRLAVRYLYLQSLQRLSQKGVIEFAVDKTNYQYLRELSGKPYRELFGAITLHYEYVWYGEINIDETLYTTIREKFTRFNKAV